MYVLWILFEPSLNTVGMYSKYKQSGRVTALYKIKYLRSLRSLRSFQERKSRGGNSRARWSHSPHRQARLWTHIIDIMAAARRLLCPFNPRCLAAPILPRRNLRKNLWSQLRPKFGIPVRLGRRSWRVWWRTWARTNNHCAFRIFIGSVKHLDCLTKTLSKVPPRFCETCYKHLDASLFSQFNPSVILPKNFLLRSRNRFFHFGWKAWFRLCAGNYAQVSNF